MRVGQLVHHRLIVQVMKSHSYVWLAYSSYGWTSEDEGPWQALHSPCRQGTSVVSPYQRSLVSGNAVWWCPAPQNSVAINSVARHKRPLVWTDYRSSLQGALHDTVSVQRW